MAKPVPTAILFDVFGTCVDWRTCVAREVAAMAAAKGVTLDALAFTDAWRANYSPSMEVVRSGKRPYVPLDVLHRETLVTLCAQFGLPLSEAETDNLNFAWHRLDPWADTVAGLGRLSTKFILSPLSNGNVRLLVDMAKRASLPWDTVLSTEVFKAYKPMPQTYLGAVEMLGCKPGEVMLTAAHNADLRAGQALGLLTAFIHRPTEYGPTQKADLGPEGDWTYIARDLEDLADQLGV
jgi:2-haloacid dehalogenase